MTNRRSLLKRIAGLVAAPFAALLPKASPAHIGVDWAQGASETGVYVGPAEGGGFLMPKEFAGQLQHYCDNDIWLCPPDCVYCYRDRVEPGWDAQPLENWED